MSLLGRMFGAPIPEPDPAEGAYEELIANDPQALAEIIVTPEMIEAEELRQAVAWCREGIEIAESNAARYDRRGEPVKAAVERKRASDDRIRMGRYQARLAEITGEVV